MSSIAFYRLNQPSLTIFVLVVAVFFRTQNKLFITSVLFYLLTVSST